ncbi:MAG: hypothetical protein MJK12_18775 [Colwellia sp.]|nr:hypothetical protein [Colwellia sp.]
MKTATNPTLQNVKIELPGSVLAQLITSGLLHGSECKCLDIHAKNILWQSLLTSSLNNEG